MTNKKIIEEFGELDFDGDLLLTILLRGNISKNIAVAERFENIIKNFLLKTLFQQRDRLFKKCGDDCSEATLKALEKQKQEFKRVVEEMKKEETRYPEAQGDTEVAHNQALTDILKAIKNI